jgi:hypothetical protein
MKTSFYYCFLTILLSAASSIAQTSISGVVNDYTAVNDIDCDNVLTVADAGAFAAGDKVMLVQMQGATIDLSNSSSFGTITDFGSAGKYEINEVSSSATGTVGLLFALENTYDFSAAVQLVRIPVYESALVADTLTCPAWDGSTGGIIAFIVSGELIMEAPIIATGKGFSGGEEINYPDSCPVGLSFSGYRTSVESGNGAPKGAGLAVVGDSQRGGRGKLANGGGGGNDHNAGGGGGSLGASGGNGGERIESFFSCPGPGYGLPGFVPDNSNAANRIYLGGGGGCGHGNNGNGSAGGNGGGIIFIKAGSMDGNGQLLAANGTSSANANGDGAGGGGAGGTLLLDIGGISSDVLVELRGGNGGSVTGIACTGPGGGGSGGLVRHTGSSLPAGIFIDYAGGTAGTTLTAASDCYEDSNGATNGAIGITQNEWPLLEADLLFTNEFATVTSDTTLCEGSSVTLNAAGGSSYSWSPVTGLSDATIANPICTITETTAYVVTVTNAAGCSDTAAVTVTIAPGISATAGPDTSICGAGQVQFFASGGDSYLWSPGDGVSDITSDAPTVFVTSTTDYVVTVDNGVCSATDTVSVEVLDLPVLITNSDTTLCAGQPIILSVGGAVAYSWEPAGSVPCPDCSIMEVTPAATTTYTVTGINTDGCESTVSFTVTVEICNSIDAFSEYAIMLYPNPAKDALFIQSAKPWQEDVALVIFDALGKQVQALVLPASNSFHRIDTGELPNGSYLLQIDGSAVHTFMVQH